MFAYVRCMTSTGPDMKRGLYLIGSNERKIGLQGSQKCHTSELISEQKQKKVSLANLPKNVFGRYLPIAHHEFANIGIFKRTSSPYSPIIEQFSTKSMTYKMPEFIFDLVTSNRAITHNAAHNVGEQ